jgi:transcriptional regulator with XRE-family HTH domain
MRESDAVESARRAIGSRLAICRRASGYSQAGFASLIDYSRSTIANVETGRQRVPRTFWTTADAALGTEGALTEVNDEIEAAVRRERQDAARQAGQFPLWSAGTECSVRSLIRAEGSGATSATPGRSDAWFKIISLAASEAREHAESAAVSDIGPAAVEQFTADVVRLARAYVSAPPFPLFAAMRRVLGAVQAALDGKAFPAQVRDLNFLAGALCGLMANASLDMGRHEAADDLARAAWTYGRILEHDPLIGWARGTQALAAIWDHRYLDALRHAEDGLLHVPAGAGAARLHAIHARALAGHGDGAQARAAIGAAERCRSDEHPDELHDGIGGEFAFSDAKLLYYKALTLVEADEPSQAGRAAEAAISIYRNGAARARSYGCEALARTQLAKAQLMTTRLEDAVDTLGHVLELDPQMRIGSLAYQIDSCRQLLRVPAYRNSGTVRELNRQLAAFTSAGAVHALGVGQ